MAGDYDLDGRVAVVTGGAGLIGAGIAAVLAQRGARVLVVDLDERRAEAVARGICEAGGLAAAVAADVGDEAAVERAFAHADALGTGSPGSAGSTGVGVLVNCAAPVALALRERPADRLEVATWDEMLRVALRGTMLCSRAALARMVPAGGGAIVNISSIHAYAGDLALVAYPVAKAGIIALTRAIATQYGRSGIRCNAVCPGTIPPPGLPAADLARRLRHQAIERPGDPDDVAQAVAYLAGPAASFITGQALVVDGGVLCHLPSFADGGHIQASG
jgi:NAD(P)-dependent dehydrogenase (short-subunit alcohol dehydrogenase family)